MDISVNILNNGFIDSIIQLTDEPIQNKYTNVLLIDCNVPSYNAFVDAVNADTYPIVYSTDESSNALIELLRSKFTTIPRLGVCFVSPINNAPTRFLDNGLLFANSDNGEVANANVQFVANMITEFGIKNIDFLGCNTLNYSNWKNYYDLLTKTTGVIVGASVDKTGNLKYGGDWIMESTSQDIELVYFTESIEYYSYLLDTTGWITTPYIIQTSPIANPLAMVSDGIYIYGSYFDKDAGKIFRINIATKEVSESWVSNPELKSVIWQMVIYGDYLYGTLGAGSVFRIKIKDVTTQPPTDISYNLFAKKKVYYRGIAASNNKLYITAYDTASIDVYDLINNSITTTFVGSTISTYVSGLSIPNMNTNTDVGLGHLFIYNNYLYAATNENGKIQRVFRWSLTAPTTDNNMNFMAQGTDSVATNSIFPDRTCGWLCINKQLYVVRFDNPAIISRLNLDNLTDYTYNYYSTTTATASPQIYSGLANDNTYLYFQDTLQKLYQINIIRPTTPLSTVLIDGGNTYTVGFGNLKVSITDPSNGLNDVYYQYSISGVNNNAFTTANTFTTGVGSFSFYINNISGLTDVSYTINVKAKNPLGETTIASQPVVLYTLPSSITNSSVVYANGNINVSITETLPVTYYYLNNVSYLYYLYTTGTNQSSTISAYTVGANVTSTSYTTIFSIPNIPVSSTKYKIYLIARNQLGNTIANVFSTNVYSIPSATVLFDAGNTKTVASGNLQVQLIDPSNISINDVYYYYSINNTSDASFVNTYVKANVSPYSFFIPSITDISNTIYVRASNPNGNSSPAANLAVIVYQTPRQPTIQLDLVGRGNVQVTITESGTVPSYYYLNNISYYLYAYNNYSGSNLSGNTSVLVYNRPVGILSKTNYTYENAVSYVNTGLSANTYTMYVIATNPFGNSVPVYANISVYTNNPEAPTIDTGNTISSSSGYLTVSINDNKNTTDNGVYYWYSTDNITYGNSGVAKTTATNYRFSINNTGNPQVPFVVGTYTLYIRAYNPLGFASALGSPYSVKVYTDPQIPTIVKENTYITKLKRLTVSIFDAVNTSNNDIYYYYSTDNITYGNSGIAKTTDTTYQFTITDTGNALIPLTTNTYSLYIRAQNPIGNVTTSYYTVLERNIPSSAWLEYANYSNKFNQTYFRNFIDVNGECIVRNGSLTVANDGTFAGSIYSNKNLNLVGNGYIQNYLTVDNNIVTNSNLSVKDTSNLNKLNTAGDASFNANIFVSNNTSLNKLLVTGDASFSGNMIVLKNTTLNSGLTVNKDTTILGKMYGASDATFGSKMIVSLDTTLKSSLSVFGQTNVYGYRSYPVLDFLRNVNIQADYNFSERSSNRDPIDGDAASIANPYVLNTFTNATDASFNRTINVYITSDGIKYYYANSLLYNKGGLVTNPIPSQNITNITTHLFVNFTVAKSIKSINWNFFEILTKNTLTDASYSSLYVFNLTTDANGETFTISDNASKSAALTNPDFKSGNSIWISVSQNIITGDSAIYLNGNSLCSFGSVARSSALKSYILYSVGYSYSESTDRIGDNGEKTIKRIIIDYNGNYANTYLPQMISVFNTYNTLYVQPVTNVNNDSLIINGNTNIQNKLDVAGNATLKQQLAVVGDVSFGSNLYVASNATIQKQLAVVGDVSFGSNLYVASNATIQKQLAVMGDASFNKNINANTISIIGDVSFVSPTGTLYVNNIKLKRSSGITGTTTGIDSNTISTGLINVDSLYVNNGIFPGYITSTGPISASSFTVSGTASGGGGVISAGTISATSISVGLTTIKDTGGIETQKITIAPGGTILCSAGTISAQAMLTSGPFNSTDTITAGSYVNAKSMFAGTAVTQDPGIIKALNTITGGSFATTNKTAVSGEINSEKMNASGSITAGGDITARGAITASGEITAESFKTTNSSCTISKDGAIRAESIVATGTITISGQTQLSTINVKDTITASGEITAASFKTTNLSSIIYANGAITGLSFKTNNAPYTADNGGISITTVKASNNITTDGATYADSFTTTGKTAVSGQGNVNTIYASSTITAIGAVAADSFTTTGKIPVAGQVTVDKVNATSTITAIGAVAADSFTTTGKTPVAGQGNVNTIYASSTITAIGAVAADSFTTTGKTPVAGQGNVNTIYASSTITAIAGVTANSFTTTGKTAVAGQVTVEKVNASSTITAESFTTTGKTPVIGQGNVNTIYASSTITAIAGVTAESFTTTGKTAVAGQVTVEKVNAAGIVTAQSFNATSDKRLKQNINDMPPQWENIKALKPAEYTWSENSKYDCGFIAQQIYTVYPHLRPTLENVVMTDLNKEDCPVTKDGEPIYYTIDYGKMTPYLCKGLQEVMSETEQLKQEIAELKAQIQSLLKK